MKEDRFTETNEQRSKQGGTAIFIAISILVFAVLVLFITAIAVTRKTNDPPALFGYRFMIADYSNMKPAIPQNSLIIVKNTKLNDLKMNDIITVADHYDNDNNKVIVSSRIVELNPTEDGMSFYTRADNSAVTDRNLRKAGDIFGKVVWTSSELGSFMLFLKSPLGLILLVALPLLILLVVEILNLIRVHKAPQEDFADENEHTAHMFGTHSRAGKKVDKGLSDMSASSIEPPSVNSLKEASYVPFEDENASKISKIFTKNDDRRDGFDQGFKIETVEQEQEILNSMDSFAFLRTKKIVTKAEEDAEQIRVLNQFANGERKLAVITNSSETNFSATMQPKGRDRFNIDGIDVKVEPKSLQLDFEENSSREISITVTKEYTNVVIECKEYEVNFALFKEAEADEDRVIIQRKPK